MNSTCTPQPLAQLYKRLLSSLNSGSVSASVTSGGRRLWPRWSAGERVTGRAGTGVRKMSTISLDGLVSWPRWLSISAIQSDITTALKQRMPKPTKVKAKSKRRPDLNSSIYSLMNSPVLFDPVRVPRNKIVLCHGLYGFDVRGPSFFPRLQLHYWSKVLDILRGKVGADVVVTGVPGTGSIRDRATLLHNVLSERVPNQSVNFIAHSMGGLDCRHLISTIQPTEYTPVSLTTVSTPHRGSSFMDWCSANIGIGSGEMEQSAKEAITEAAKKAGEKYVPPYTLSTPLLSRPNPNSSTAEQATSLAQSTLAQLATLPQSLTSLLLALLDSPAYANLTTHFLANSFNPQTPNLPNVKYFSVGARAPADMSVFHPLWLPKTILDAAEERHAGRTPEWGADEGRDARRWNGHDGLVSIASARWGEFLGVIEGVDHWELRGGSGVYSDSPSSPNSSAGWTEWAKSFGIWRDARERETVVSQTDGSEEGKQRAAVTAALDWVVNTVSSSHAANPGAPRDPVKVEERRLEEEKRNRGEGVPVFDLERFYVALCRKLYDEGL